MQRSTHASWDPFASWPRARPWIWAALAVFVVIVQGPSFVRSFRPARGQGVDFFQEWSSARNVLEGLPVYMDLGEAVERHLGLQSVRIEVDVNAHPPTSILLVVPFAWLDYPDATLVWNLLSLAMLIPSFWLISRALGFSPPTWSVFPLIVLLLLCNPLRQQVQLGQLNLVLLLLLTGIWVAARSQRPWLAGSLLGLATAIKLFPGFLFLYFLLRRNGKAVIAGAASFVLLTALTVAVMGVDTYRSYIVEVLPRNERCHSGWKNASVPGLWKKLFDPATQVEYIEPLRRSPLLARAGALVSCLTIVLLLSWAIVHGQKTMEGADHTFGLSIIAMLLVSPIAWDHYFVLLLIPLAILIAEMPPHRSTRATFLLLVLVLFVDPATWHEWLIPGGRGANTAVPWQTLTALSLQCYALFGLFVFGLRMNTLHESSA